MISVAVSPSPLADVSSTSCSSAANSSETGSSPRPANTAVGNLPDSADTTLVEVLLPNFVSTAPPSSMAWPNRAESDPLRMRRSPTESSAT